MESRREAEDDHQLPSSLVERHYIVGAVTEPVDSRSSSDAVSNRKDLASRYEHLLC